MSAVVVRNECKLRVKIIVKKPINDYKASVGKRGGYCICRLRWVQQTLVYQAEIVCTEEPNSIYVCCCK